MISIDSLRAKLSAEQRAMLDRLWEKTGAGPVLARDLFHDLPMPDARRTLDELGGSLVLEMDGPADESYSITLLGAMLTKGGEALEALAASFAEYVVTRYKKEADVERVTSAEASRDLKLEGASLDRVFRLAVLTGLSSASSPNDGGWWIRVPQNIHDLASVKDWRAQIEEIALRSYDPQLPVRAVARRVYLARPRGLRLWDWIASHRLKAALAVLATLVTVWAGLVTIGIIPAWKWSQSNAPQPRKSAVPDTTPVARVPGPETSATGPRTRRAGSVRPRAVSVIHPTTSDTSKMSETVAMTPPKASSVLAALDQEMTIRLRILADSLTAIHAFEPTPTRREGREYERASRALGSFLRPRDSYSPGVEHLTTYDVVQNVVRFSGDQTVWRASKYLEGISENDNVTPYGVSNSWSQPDTMMILFRAPFSAELRGRPVREILEQLRIPRWSGGPHASEDREK